MDQMIPNKLPDKLVCLQLLLVCTVKNYSGSWTSADLPREPLKVCKKWPVQCSPTGCDKQVLVKSVLSRTVVVFAAENIHSPLLQQSNYSTSTPVTGQCMQYSVHVSFPRPLLKLTNTYQMQAQNSSRRNTSAVQDQASLFRVDREGPQMNPGTQLSLIPYHCQRFKVYQENPQVMTVTESLNWKATQIFH